MKLQALAGKRFRISGGQTPLWSASQGERSTKGAAAHVGDTTSADGARVAHQIKGRVRHRHASQHVVRDFEGHGVCVEAHTAQLEKKRDELKFRAARAEIEDMLAAVDRGEIDLAYCDEAGFTQTHPNRSA